MRRKVVVTGGAGFIGSHVVDSYIERGWNVLVIDDLSTGKMENVNPKADFLKLDIRDKKLVDVIKRFSPDLVNHHAAQINLRKSVEDPIYDAEVNIIGALNLLEGMKCAGVSRIIFASTGGAIYGETEIIPTPEDLSPSPISPYGIAKRSCEMYIEYYSKVWGFRSTILRYGNVYGQRQDPYGEAGVVAIFISKILNGGIPVIFGDGNQTRDYVFVEDVVKLNMMVSENEILGVYNVGTGRELSVNELFSIIKKLMEASVNPIYEAQRPGELKRSCLSIEKIRSKGWSFLPFEEGLKRTIEWFRSRRGSK